MPLRKHPLVEVFESERKTCTFYHDEGGCLNCLSYGPGLCQQYGTEFVTVSLTDIFDKAVLDLNQSPVNVFKCYLDERRRLRRDMHNRVLNELLARHRLRRPTG